MRMKGPENLVVAPHPYFPWAPSCGRLLDSRPELFDAVEHSHLYNGWINFNRKAVRRAAEFGLPVVGTSDAHTLAQVGYNYTLVYSEKTPEVVIAAIKAGRCELATRPLPVTVFLWVILKMKYESAVRWLRRQATLFR
jgi:predicted metal-dependent phosphoesterase TrpH